MHGYGSIATVQIGDRRVHVHAPRVEVLADEVPAAVGDEEVVVAVVLRHGVQIQVPVTWPEATRRHQKSAI